MPKNEKMKKRIKKLFHLQSLRRGKINMPRKTECRLLAVSIKFEITCSEKQLLVHRMRTTQKFITEFFVGLCSNKS
jgi:hypothetical protein